MSADHAARLGEQIPPESLIATATPRRWGTAILLALATAIGGLGLAAGGTAGALLAVDMVGSDAVAGLPTSAHLIGAALGALLVSGQAARGRRDLGLALGFATGAAGAAIVLGAVWAHSFVLVLGGHVVLGTANSAIFLARYAAAASVPEQARGRAIGLVLLGTSFGAVLSPLLIGPSRTIAEYADLPAAAGMYAVAVAAFAAVTALLASVSVAHRRRGNAPSAGSPGERLARGIPRAIKDPSSRPAILVLAVVNAAMVGLMTVAPVHLAGHGSGLGSVGGIVAVHVACMFAPAPLTGYLTDRFRPAAPIALSAALLLLGGVAGPIVGAHGTVAMIAQLAVLGLAWNAGIVGGSALLGMAVAPRWRTHTEAVGEIAMGGAAVVAAPLAGLLAAGTNYAGASLFFGVLSAAGIAGLYRRLRTGNGNDEITGL